MHDVRDEIAALNNAEWCAAIWRSHGLPVETAQGLWFCRRPTPQYYPNVVTVELGADPLAQTRFITDLRRADPDLDLSVKDSFACLDLKAVGLRPLFDARWLWRAAPSAGTGDETLDWRRIEGEPGLALWERAWRGEDQNSERIFRAELLEDRHVTVLGGFDAAGILGSGGIAYDAAGVLGVTNIFGSRRRVLNALRASAPGRPVVAYEAGGDPASAQSCGFEPLGALRVWVRA